MSTYQTYSTFSDRQFEVEVDTGTPTQLSDHLSIDNILKIAETNTNGMLIFRL